MNTDIFTTIQVSAESGCDSNTPFIIGSNSYAVVNNCIQSVTSTMYVSFSVESTDGINPFAAGIYSGNACAAAPSIVNSYSQSCVNWVTTCADNNIAVRGSPVCLIIRCRDTGGLPCLVRVKFTSSKTNEQDADNNKYYFIGFGIGIGMLGIFLIWYCCCRKKPIQQQHAVGAVIYVPNVPQIIPLNRQIMEMSPIQNDVQVDHEMIRTQSQHQMSSKRHGSQRSMIPNVSDHHDEQPGERINNNNRMYNESEFIQVPSNMYSNSNSNRISPSRKSIRSLPSQSTNIASIASLSYKDILSFIKTGSYVYIYSYDIDGSMMKKQMFLFFSLDMNCLYYNEQHHKNFKNSISLPVHSITDIYGNKSAEEFQCEFASNVSSINCISLITFPLIHSLHFECSNQIERNYWLQGIIAHCEPNIRITTDISGK
jgi:hypothetical protein